MSGLSLQQAARPQPRHPIYVSIQNGVIQHAMSSPSGYEDEHPEDWRPATHAEREQFLAGIADNVNGQAQPAPLPLGASSEALQPTTLTLQADDPMPVDIVAPVAPAPVAAAPIAPAVPVDGALSVGAPAPAPAIPPAPPAAE